MPRRDDNKVDKSLQRIAPKADTFWCRRSNLNDPWDPPGQAESRWPQPSSYCRNLADHTAASDFATPNSVSFPSRVAKCIVSHASKQSNGVRRRQPGRSTPSNPRPGPNYPHSGHDV